MDLSSISTPPPPKKRQSKLERVDASLDAILAGEDFERILKALSPEERALFDAQITNMRETGEFDLDDLWKIDYVRQPPTIGEFITDEYWLGGRCLKNEAEGNTGLFPAWRDVLINDFDLDSRIHNAVISGSLGIGKSFVSVLLLLYRICLARCMRNPQSFLGLAKGSLVLYVLMSTTKDNVTETVWAEALNFMAASPFFREECNFDPSKKYASLRIHLGGNIFLTAGSRSQHILGRNTLGVLLDEGNWRLEGNPDLKAYELFNQVRTRLTNRFQKIDGYLPALSLLASSARDESSVTEQVINEILTTSNPATERVYRFSVYKVKREELRLGPRWFRVEHGIKNQEPRILSGFFTEGGVPIREVGLAPEEPTSGASVELVPERYLAEFKRELKPSLQSICGISTGGTHRFFSSLEHVAIAILSAKTANIENPCPMDYVSLSDENPAELWEMLDHKKFLTKRGGSTVPKHDSGALRYVHLDLATTGVAGLAICHAVEPKLVEGLYDKKTGGVFSQYRRVVSYDFIFALTAGQVKPISIKKIQDFLFWLRDYCNFRYGKITCDSYGAGLPLQPFEAKEIPTDILSLDKTKVPYYSWRNGFDEDRIVMFQHPVLLREVEYLIDHPSPIDKIDHPQKTPYGEGTKDIADACAGAYFSCITDELKTAGNTQPHDVTLHADSKDVEPPPVIAVVPDTARPVREFGD